MIKASMFDLIVGDNLNVDPTINIIDREYGFHIKYKIHPTGIVGAISWQIFSSSTCCGSCELGNFISTGNFIPTGNFILTSETDIPYKNFFKETTIKYWDRFIFLNHCSCFIPVLFDPFWKYLILEIGFELRDKFLNPNTKKIIEHFVWKRKPANDKTV